MSSSKSKRFIHNLLELGKVRITIPVTITALTGYLANRSHIDINILLPILGVFLLASGAAALNHIQEIAIDKLMERTKNRPVPSGAMSALSATIATILMLLMGSVALYFGSPTIMSLIVGWVTVIWYNLIYTYLKRITAFAVVPGAMVGALPPLIGWTASGGLITDPQAIMLGFFFFIAQIPHFWLIILRIGKQYEQAGLPSLTALLSDKQIKNLTFIWLVATAVASMLFIIYGIITSAIISILLIASSIFVVYIFRGLIFDRDKEINLRFSFIRINLYFLFIMILVCCNGYL